MIQSKTARKMMCQLAWVDKLAIVCGGVMALVADWDLCCIMHLHER